MIGDSKVGTPKTPKNRTTNKFEFKRDDEINVNISPRLWKRGTPSPKLRSSTTKSKK